MEENGAGRLDRIERNMESLYDLTRQNAAAVQFLLEHAKRTDERLDRVADGLDYLSVRMNELGERVDSLVVAIGQYIRAREEREKRQG